MIESQSLLSINVGVPQSILIVLTAIILYSLPYARIFNPYTTPLNQLKGPPFIHFFYGSYDRQVMKEIKVHHRLTQWNKQFGNVFFGVQQGRKPFAYVKDRKAATFVFLTKSKTFMKPISSNRILSLFFGEALLGVDGKQHARQRKVAFPAFTQNAINDLTPLFVKTGDALVERWNRLIDRAPHEVATEGVSLNAFSEFANAALDVIGKAGFGYDFKTFSDESSELTEAFEKIFSLLVTGSVYSSLRHNSATVQKIGSYCVEEQKELDRARAIVDKVSNQLVEKAKKEALEEAKLEGDGKIKKDSFASKDLLSLLVRSNLSNDLKPSERISDHEIVSFVPTFLAAGHETTSTALSWCSYAFTSSEKGLESQRRLRKELKSNPSWRNSAKDIDESLPYLSAVSKEVLRLFAPVRATIREATESDVIPLDNPIEMKDGSKSNSFRVQKGDIIWLDIVGLNTEVETWGEDAKIFRPERFIDDENHEFFEGGLTKEAREIKNGWSGLQTFTIGPRNCIGMRMAILEFQCIIASVISNFELLPPTEKVEIDYRQAIVARPIVIGQEKKGFQLPIRIRRI